jgi:DHA2 family multidrug resistance protein
LMSVTLTSRFNNSSSIAAASRADSIRGEAARRGLPTDLTTLPSQVLAPDFMSRLASDLSHAYAGAFVIATILLAATAIPASFLPKHAAANLLGQHGTCRGSVSDKSRALSGPVSASTT